METSIATLNPLFSTILSYLHVADTLNFFQTSKFINQQQYRTNSVIINNLSRRDSIRIRTLFPNLRQLKVSGFSPATLDQLYSLVHDIPVVELFDVTVLNASRNSSWDSTFGIQYLSLNRCNVLNCGGLLSVCQNVEYLRLNEISGNISQLLHHLLYGQSKYRLCKLKSVEILQLLNPNHRLLRFSLPKLERLCVTKSPFLTCIAMDAASSSKLKDLSVCGTGISSSSLMKLIKVCKHLEKLTADECDNLTGNLEIVSRTLSSVSLECCRQLAELRIMCPQLQVINLTMCCQLKTLELQSNFLVALDLQMLTCLSSVVLSIPTLRKLDITGCWLLFLHPWPVAGRLKTIVDGNEGVQLMDCPLLDAGDIWNHYQQYIHVIVPELQTSNISETQRARTISASLHEDSDSSASDDSDIDSDSESVGISN